MEHTRAKQPRLFSAANWANATLPLMGLALPAKVFADTQDDFAFGAQAPEPEMDLTDIVPAMIRHFGSVQYQLGRHDLKLAGDGSTYLAAAPETQQGAEPPQDAQADTPEPPQSSDIAG